MWTGSNPEIHEILEIIKYYTTPKTPTVRSPELVGALNMFLRAALFPLATILQIEAVCDYVRIFDDFYEEDMASGHICVEGGTLTQKIHHEIRGPKKSM